MAKKKKKTEDEQIAMDIQSKRDRLTSVLKTINKNNPKGAVGFLDDEKILGKVNYEKLSTGIPQVDQIMDGGVPRGKFTVFTGKAGSGKSTMAMQVMAQHLEKDPDAVWVWVDSENSWDGSWAETMGVDESRVIWIQSSIMEDCLQQMIDLAKSGDISGCVLDSIGALLPRAEAENPTKSATSEATSRTLRQENVAVLNRKIGQFYRAAGPTMAQNNVACILISHVYTDINSMGHGEKLVTKGGNATAHWAHVRVAFRRRTDMDMQVEIMMPDGRKAKTYSGFQSVIKVEKSKQGAHEGHEVFIPFTKGIGFDSKQCTINAALVNGVFEQRGAWIYSNLLPDEGKVQGKKKLFDLILGDDELYMRVLNDVLIATSDELIDTETGEVINTMDLSSAGENSETTVERL